MNSSFSKRKIQPFIHNNHIDMSQYVQKEYSSYNDFFTRHIIEGQRQIRLEENIFIAPADSKLTYYPITENIQLKIKN